MARVYHVARFVMFHRGYSAGVRRRAGEREGSERVRGTQPAWILIGFRSTRRDRIPSARAIGFLGARRAEGVTPPNIRLTAHSFTDVY